MYIYVCHQLSVWVASSYKFHIIINLSSFKSPVTHNLFDQSNIFSSVGFIKEQYGIKLRISLVVTDSQFLSIYNCFTYVFFRCSTMDLYNLRLLFSFIYTYLMLLTFNISKLLTPVSQVWRSHIYLINLVFPQPVSPIITTGISHL